MQVIDMQTMKEAIKQIVIRKNRPCIFIGPSGCGNSEGVEQACAEEGAFMTRFMLGQYGRRWPAPPRSAARRSADRAC